MRCWVPSFSPHNCATVPQHNSPTSSVQGNVALCKYKHHIWSQFTSVCYTVFINDIHSRSCQKYLIQYYYFLPDQMMHSFFMGSFCNHLLQPPSSISSPPTQRCKFVQVSPDPSFSTPTNYWSCSIEVVVAAYHQTITLACNGKLEGNQALNCLFSFCLNVLEQVALTSSLCDSNCKACSNQCTGSEPTSGWSPPLLLQQLQC